MVFALGAGRRFELDNGGEFEETIICTFTDVGFWCYVWGLMLRF